MTERSHSFNALDAIDLIDWKHSIFDLYAEIRASPDPVSAWHHWRVNRDAMYQQHPQSPIPEAARATFDGCRFYDYDPSWRVIAQIAPSTPERRGLPVSTGETFSFTRIGVARFTLGGPIASSS